MLDFLFKKEKPTILRPVPPYSHIDCDEYEKAIEIARRLEALGNTVNVGKSAMDGKPRVQIIGKRDGI